MPRSGWCCEVPWPVDGGSASEPSEYAEAAAASFDRGREVSSSRGKNSRGGGREREREREREIFSIAGVARRRTSMETGSGCVLGGEGVWVLCEGADLRPPAKGRDVSFVLFERSRECPNVTPGRERAERATETARVA